MPDWFPSWARCRASHGPPTKVTAGKADYTLRIGTGLVELAPDHIVSTTLYNGQFPGPLLRFKEGQRVVVDIYNDTDTPELVHWHGQMIPSDVDGAAEEGSPFVPAHGMRRIAFMPKPSGFRFYHTHVVAGGDLNRGTYTGQAGPVYIEPKNNPGAYDREVFLVMKEFAPAFSRGGDMAMDVLAGAPLKELQADRERRPTRKRRRKPRASKSATSCSASMAGCSVTASPSASSRANGCCSMCSMRARPRSAASLCPAMSSASSRSTAIRSRRKRTCPCSGSAPPSASRRSSK